MLIMINLGGSVCSHSTLQLILLDSSLQTTLYNMLAFIAAIFHPSFHVKVPNVLFSSEVAFVPYTFFLRWEPLFMLACKVQ